MSRKKYTFLKKDHFFFKKKAFRTSPHFAPFRIISQKMKADTGDLLQNRFLKKIYVMIKHQFGKYLRTIPMKANY